MGTSLEIQCNVPSNLDLTLRELGLRTVVDAPNIQEPFFKFPHQIILFFISEVNRGKRLQVSNIKENFSNYKV